ncbi:MarR family transcriptional regulator [Peribacillus frigoritolerans]|nr:MarR family transcriptional regulator [Peribacillus frigoritolerans]
MHSSELYNLHLEIRELSSLSQELVEPLLVKYDLTSVQYRALQLIVLNESIAVKDVSNHLKIKPAAGTALIDRLERKKLIERVHSEDDRAGCFLSNPLKVEGIPIIPSISVLPKPFVTFIVY